MEKQPQKKQYCLGIETTAHTFGASVVNFKGIVHSNVIDAYKTVQGGMIPHDVSEHHVNVCSEVISKALTEASLSITDVSLISVSSSPGIGHMLKVGCMAARSLAFLHDIPLVGVNHCIAHLEIGRLLTHAKDPILLYASGANTQVIAFEGGKYRIFGETIDTGVGNFLDTFARTLGLGFPGGPKIEELAKKTNQEELLELPYTVKGMDVAFSGLLTHLEQKWKSGKYSKEELCHSLQETAFAMLVEVAERALAHTGKTELVLGGGVACNKRLQEMADLMCKDRGAQCFVPENQFLVDNAAMIAWTGILSHQGRKEKEMNVSEVIANPYLRTDEVGVDWR
jgi:N6-L-threonylcarbamoyladenine synthase